MKYAAVFLCFFIGYMNTAFAYIHPRPAPSGNKFIEKAVDDCYPIYYEKARSSDRDSGYNREWLWKEYKYCVESNVDSNYQEADEAAYKAKNTLQEAAAALGISVFFAKNGSQIIKSVTENANKVFTKLQGTMGEYLDAIFKTRVTPFSGPRKEDLATDNIGLDPHKPDSARWTASRTTCCGSATQRFKESTEELGNTLASIVKEAINTNNNLVNQGLLTTALKKQMQTHSEQIVSNRLQSLNQISIRKAAAMAHFEQVRNYGELATPSDHFCSDDFSNIVNGLPFANKWMGGTFSIRTVKTSHKPLINPNLLLGKGTAKDELEQWLSKNEAFQPDNLWSIFSMENVGSTGGRKFKLFSFARIFSGGRKTVIEPSFSDRAPIIKTTRPTAGKLSSSNISYSPIEKATTYIVNMMLDDATLPASLDPSGISRDKNSGYNYIKSDIPAYTTSAHGTSTHMDYRHLRNWLHNQSKLNNPFSRHFMAQMGIREIHAAVIKNVFTSYMLDRYKPYTAPNNLSATESLVKGFVDAYLPANEQSNSAAFSEISINTDSNFLQWAEDLGIQVETTFTASQKRDMTIRLLTHPYMKEVVTRTQGDELMRLLIKHQNTLMYLRKMRLDEIKKQRLLLTVINDNENNSQKIINAAMGTAQAGGM